MRKKVLSHLEKWLNFFSPPVKSVSCLYASGKRERKREKKMKKILRASLATHCHFPSISFHFFQKYQIKNILTFLNFLYHINYVLLLFK
jgi:hypothetical protein